MKKSMLVCIMSLTGIFCSGVPSKSLQGARNIAISGDGGSDLPPGLTAVEYLESTGTQWIDTGVYMNGLDSVDIKICRLGTKDCGIFGTRIAYVNNQFMLRHESSGKLDFYYANNPTDRFPSIEYEQDYDIAISDGSIFINEENVGAYQIADFNLVNKCYLFCTNNYPGLFIGRIYSFRIGSKVDFVPVRFTNEQGVLEGAMYDRVSGELFRNAGTGYFIIGPDKR